MTSWKTTVAGIAAIVVALGTAVGALFDADPLTTPDWGRSSLPAWPESA